MDDVQAAAGLFREYDSAPNSLKLGHNRPGLQIISDAGATFDYGLLGERGCYRLTLGVDGHKAAQSGRFLHALIQSCVIYCPEVIDATIRHECFKADYATLGKRFQVPDVARHKA